MITLEDWALIRRLHVGEGVPKAQIAKQLGISRNTVAKAIASTSPPKYERPPVANAFTTVEERVRQLLQEVPSMPATVLAERVGWTRSSSWFRGEVARIRPEYAPVDPADRLVYSPGDQAQCDLWFPPAKIPLGDGQLSSPPVLVVVASYSKFITATMLPTRTTPDLLAGMWSLLSAQLGAVPHRLIWDNEAGIGRGNKFAEGVSSFTGTLATKIVQLKPFDPESKGIVERMNQYLETSFMPGRSFSSPHDFNAQLASWLPQANNRMVRTLRARPVDLITHDKQAMLSLPPVSPVVGFHSQVRLGRDYYVRVLSNDYSVDPVGIGRMVEITASLSTVTITITCEGRTLGSHARVWGTLQIVTDPAHVRSALVLRQQFQHPAAWAEPSFDRDLADYDTAFGVRIEGAGQ